MKPNYVLDEACLLPLTELSKIAEICDEIEQDVATVKKSLDEYAPYQLTPARREEIARTESPHEDYKRSRELILKLIEDADHKLSRLKDVEIYISELEKELTVAQHREHQERSSFFALLGCASIVAVLIFVSFVIFSIWHLISSI